jgi:hypothetical protein
MQGFQGWHVLLLICVVVVAFAVTSEAAPSLVISQVYTGSLGPYSFIELFNPSSTPTVMDGWSIQASSPDIDTPWTVAPLSGTVNPGQYYLIRLATNSSRTTAPTPDTTVTAFQLDAGGGQLAIVQNNTRLLVPCSFVGSFASVVDFISWGSSSCGSITDPWQDDLSAIRSGAGCTDISVAALFSLDTPIPRNSQSITNPCGISSTAALQAYNVPSSGGFSTTTTGTGPALTGGFARLEPSSGTSNPTALAIFALRQSGTLISEASVPATPPLLAGYFFVDVTGPINTGVAIANMNTDSVDVQYQVTDAGSGATTQTGIVTLPPKSQIARFMNELPFGLRTPVQGTFTFIASEPVSVIALRGNTNTRGDFLVTTLPVVDVNAPVSTAPAYVAHFAVNNGWKTDLLLMCPSPSPCNGTVTMRDATGTPVTVKADALVANSFPYTLVPFGSEKVTLTAANTQTSGGTIQITSSDGSATPIATAVFSYSNTNGITVSEAGVTTPIGTQFRTYVEYSGQAAAVGSIQPGVAIANTVSSSNTVTLSLTGLDGSATGLSTTLTIPGNGQIAKFVNELFPSLAVPFKGILTVTGNGGPIAVIGLRGHYNERREFLITTIPAVDQNATIPTTQLVFPHIVDSGGYTTQFVLFGSTGQASNGNIHLFTTGGQPLSLQFQ